MAIVTDFSQLLFVVIVALLGIPVLGSAMISVLVAHINGHLGTKLGENSLVIFSGLGTIVHELSHAGMALLFGHKIDDMRLLQRPFVGDHAGRMGYVSHVWTPGNIYQQMGNFFIGIAPVFGISGAIALITEWLWPALFDLVDLRWDVFLTEPWWRIVIWVLLTVNLGLGMHLSRADWRGALTGVMLYISLLVILASVLAIMGVDYILISQMLLVPIVLFFSIFIGTIGVLWLIVTVLF